MKSNYFFTSPSVPETLITLIAAAAMPDAIPSAPAPWTLKGDVYLFSFWTSKEQARHLPSHAFSPLEAGGTVAGVGSAASKPVGGLSMIQVIRYTESPVGPYDELIVIPGNFEWTKEDKEGRRTKKKNVRISRIYVSQKDTCYNGRVSTCFPSAARTHTSSSFGLT